MQYDTRYDMTWHDMTQHDMIWYYTLRYDMVSYHTFFKAYPDFCFCLLLLYCQHKTPRSVKCLTQLAHQYNHNQAFFPQSCRNSTQHSVVVWGSSFAFFFFCCRATFRCPRYGDRTRLMNPPTLFLPKKHHAARYSCGSYKNDNTPDFLSWKAPPKTVRARKTIDFPVPFYSIQY